jgi:hypothetical protein
LVNFMAKCYIFLVWYIFPALYGMLYQDKTGNPGSVVFSIQAFPAT